MRKILFALLLLFTIPTTVLAWNSTEPPASSVPSEQPSSIPSEQPSPSEEPSSPPSEIPSEIPSTPPETPTSSLVPPTESVLTNPPTIPPPPPTDTNPVQDRTSLAVYWIVFTLVFGSAFVLLLVKIRKSVI